MLTQILSKTNNANSAVKWLTSIGLALQLGNAGAVPALSSTIISASAAGHDRFYAVAFDDFGNSYAAGSVAANLDKSADYKMIVAKFDPTGSLDKSFGANGFASINAVLGTDGEVARAIKVQGNGKIIIAGTVEHLGAADSRDRDLALLRLNSDGTQDQSFGKEGLAIFDLSDGVANGTAFIADGFGGIAFDNEGGILIHGSMKRQGALDTDFVMLRTSSDGILDKSFGTLGKVSLDIRGLNASPKAPVLTPDGHILGVGYQKDGAIVVPVIYKLDRKGQFDLSFGQAGIFSQPVLGLVSEVYAVAVQGTSLVTVGYGRDNDQESLDFLSMRILENGKLDTSFGTSGGYTRIDFDGYNDNGRNMVVLADGRLMLIGGGRPSATNSDGMIAVLSPDGIPDEDFGPNGTQTVDFGGSNDFLWGVAVSPTRNRALAVGIRGVGTDAGNDDSVVLSIPLK